MQNFEVVLLEQSQGDEPTPIIKAHKLNLAFQHSGITGNSMNEGNISIGGRQLLTLANGSVHETVLPEFNIRLQETENLLAGMQAGEAKTKLQAKFDIWSTFLDSIQTALGTALKAQYELDNPVQEGEAE